MTAYTGLTPSDPYVTPSGGTYTGTPGSAVFEITLTTALATPAAPVISGTTPVFAETYNGTIPGPTFRLTVGDTVIVRLVNNMTHETGIHWHGIELSNSADGTDVTQNGAVGAFTPPPAPAPAGGTYLYKFKVTRPGIFWYHPHHHHSTNRVFKGLYGLIIVTDPDEDTLADGVVLPLPADTKQIVLSDITVCKAEGMNDAATYPTAAGTEWLGSTPTIQAGATPTTPQPGPTPTILCEIPTAANGMTGAAVDDHGDPALASYAAGAVPSLEAMSGRVNEGQTVLTNGVNVGGRAGSPSAPGALAAGAYTLLVRRGQGLRLQIANCATTRYFRLRLTDGAGQKVDLVRVGGEGGVLDNAVLEGLDPMAPVGAFDPEYESGEILLPPSVRADVVVAIPDTLAVGSVLTLWTRDFKRLGPGAGGGPWAGLPTVPVMHLEVSAAPPVVPAYQIVGGYNGVGGTALRAAIPGSLVDDITTPPTTGSLLTPGTGFVAPKLGMANTDIQLSNQPGGPGVNGVQGHALHDTHPYTSAPHIGSTRYAEKGRRLELTVTNMSDAHHPFHLHGFSMQPKSLAPRAGAPMGTPTGTFTWLYKEFRDSIDVPSNYTLTFRVQLDDRPHVDGVTLGGWLGRWLFHCHIFFHHHRGMVSEFVVTDSNVKERPYVDVGGSWAYAGAAPPQRRGTFWSPEGNLVTLAATYGPAGAAALTPTVAPSVITSPAGTTPGTWSWTVDPGIANGIHYVYITATDTITSLQGQAVFRLKVGGADDGADVGDPHIRTVDGKSYDFQAVGEFILLRDREYGLEIQARQTPVETATPISDPYTGLTASVSVNTAVAARVGSHKISYQPTGLQANSPLQFFLDGKPAKLSTAGIDLDGGRVSAFDANGEMGVRVDYAHGAVLTIAPRLWHLWILDVHVAHTQADEGIMGSIPEDTWLPTLPNGATVGPMPESLHERYVTLYRTFADAWRVTDESSLFTYARETSTKTFTDRDWPAETPPSVLKPQFQIPGFPPPVNIPVPEAEEICKAVTIDYLHACCVFDVATTGDKGFAKAYLLQQDLRLRGSAVQISGDKERTRSGEPLVVTATVLPLTRGRPTPTGSVTFLIDDVAAGTPVTLDQQGRARLATNKLPVGTHTIRASYDSGDANGYQPSTSPNLTHRVEEGPGARESKSGCSPTIWIWAVLVLLVIAALVYFL